MKGYSSRLKLQIRASCGTIQCVIWFATDENLGTSTKMAWQAWDHSFQNLPFLRGCQGLLRWSIFSTIGNSHNKFNRIGNALHQIEQGLLHARRDGVFIVVIARLTICWGNCTQREYTSWSILAASDNNQRACVLRFWFKGEL